MVAVAEWLARLTERTRVRITPRTVVFIATAAAIYCLGHGLCTFTAAYVLSNNNNGDGGCGWQLSISGGLTTQVDWLSLRVGGHPALSLHSGELSQLLWS